MTASAPFADIGYRVEDGDIGYAGETHASFRPSSVARIGGCPTPRGSAVCRELLGQLRARFPQRRDAREIRAVQADAYQAAVGRVAGGR